jgi:hypothetical protein
MALALAFGIILGLWLIPSGALVYHGWLFANHPRVVQTRGRLYWRGMRAGMPYAWTIPAAVPAGLGLIAWCVAAAILTAEPENAYGIWLGLVGFPLIFLPLFLAWRRTRWFLAPWHRAEIEREAAGLEPLIPPPADGPHKTMTRRELLLGLGLAAACFVAWWAWSSLPFLIAGLNVLALMAAMRLATTPRVRNPRGKPRSRR